jgi:endonuclease/exonuclease/phosphatase (EEP) superfamily protein YafD
MMQKLFAIMTFGCIAVSGCSWQDFHLHRHGINSETPTISNDDACAAVRADVWLTDGDTLDSERIRLLTWNTQKHGHARLHDDLVRLSSDADLVLLQEAVVDAEHLTRLDGGLYWNFAPGYIKAGTATGVMTASKVRPVGYCKLASMEPWLGSPKATSITRYALEGSEQSLLVVNMHVINFTFGTDAPAKQLAAALEYVDAHTGPVIVSGDMNTWSTGREQLVLSALSDRGFTPVKLSDDNRTRIFGRVVDHIYVRGLQSTTARSLTIDSSDHNPITAELRVL